MDGGRVALHRLTFVEDGDHVLVGRPDIESYAVFPADGAEFLRRLRNGCTVAEATAWYEVTYREELDVEDFFDTLTELGFLRGTGDSAEEPDRAGDGHSGDAMAGEPAEVGLRRLAHWVFSPAAWVGYAALVATALVVLVRVRQVRPTPSAIFFTDSLTVVQFGLLAAEIPLILLHESFHVLAGRRLGLPSSLSIGRRLHFVVVQTTMTALFSVPARRRYLPLLAGIVADTVAASVLVLAAAVDRYADGSLSVLGRLAVAMAYLTMLRVAWQFLVVLETDMQHVLATALRCPGLGQMTGGYLWASLRRLLGRGDPDGEQTYYSPRERAVLRWFAPLTLVGVLALVGLAVATAGPVLTGLVHRIGHGLTSGAGHAGFWDSLVALALLLAQFGLLAGLLVRELLSRGRRAVRSRRAEMPQRSAAP